MDTHVHDVLRTLASFEPRPAPAGEPGVILPGAPASARYVPVLSVYLDWRPEATGERPGLRAARVMLRARLREIERAFWPRGAAYDAVRADAARIERYLDEQATPSAEGLAIFACAPAGLFETVETGVPFETEVMALATPNLYQMAYLLDEHEAAVVAVVDSNTARLFVSQRGLLRELKRLDEDPKYFHMMRGAPAMNHAHYQRYAVTQRRRFAEEVAQRLREVIEEVGATRVILAGDDVAAAELKAALSPDVSELLIEVPLRMHLDVTPDEVWEEIQPILREAEAEQDRTVVERLLDEALSDRLGVVGLEQTRAALEAGQAYALALVSDGQIPEEERSQLISLAAQADVQVEIVESPELTHLGGVGALLRYRLSDTLPVYIPSGPEFPGTQTTA